MQYEAVAIEQLPGAPMIVLFAAPVFDIANWAGIPQRRRLEGAAEGIETAGFQREEKPARVADIAAFMHNPANVIQNPLLAAVQDSARVKVLEIDGVHVLDISPVDLSSQSLLDLLKQAMAELEARLPELSRRSVDGDTLDGLRRSLIGSGEPGVEPGSSPLDSDEEIEDDSSEAADGVNGLTSGLFEEETQVVDFYDELNVRATVLQELGAEGASLNAIAGFDRDFLESLVKPVVLVDGQHRLRGALQAVEELAATEEGQSELAEKIDGGMPPEQAWEEFSRTRGRKLPISLLLSDDPAEHVFQFVVVNQKATPMTSALLGTIVSTSLSQEELDPIRVRLRDAGIELEGSRAIAYLSRSPSSPFRNLVSTGMSGDRPNALPWSVLGKLVSIVRNLEGGAPFHPPLIDFAKLWRDGPFQASGLVDEQLSGAERMAAWSAVDGPWREFFIRLHTRIRDKFGDPDDLTVHNAWGSTKSNLFNMISLTILTADFFQFLHANSRSLADWEDMEATLEDWIGDLNPGYFARDWRMSGTKKDQAVIRKAWSETWTEYRITRGRLPRVEKFNPGGRS